MPDSPAPGLNAFLQWARSQKPVHVVEWATTSEDWQPLLDWIAAKEQQMSDQKAAYDPQDTLKLSTGHELYANEGIFGLSPDLELSEGYDGSIQICDDGPEPLRFNEVGPAECVALANVMIARWQAFRALYDSQPVTSNPGS